MVSCSGSQTKGCQGTKWEESDTGANGRRTAGRRRGRRGFPQRERGFRYLLDSRSTARDESIISFGYEKGNSLSALDLQGKRLRAVDDDTLGHDDGHQFVLDLLNNRSTLLQGGATGASRARRTRGGRGAGGGVLIGGAHGRMLLVRG